MNFCLEHKKEPLTSLFKWTQSEWTLISSVLYFKMVGRDSEVQLCFQTSSNISPAAQRHKGSRTGGSVVCCSAAIKHWRVVVWGKKKIWKVVRSKKKKKKYLLWIPVSKVPPSSVTWMISKRQNLCITNRHFKMQWGLEKMDKNPELRMLLRTNICWLSEQLMVNKEPMWHAALWQNEQNERLWPAKWGSDLKQHNLWNVCLPPGVTSPLAAFDQCTVPADSPPPSLLPPPSSSPTGVFRGFFAHAPSVLVSTMQAAPVQGQAL